MNDTSFNKVFYDEYLFTYVPAISSAYPGVYSDIYASDKIKYLVLQVHMHLYKQTIKKILECGRRDLNPSYKLGKLM